MSVSATTVHAQAAEALLDGLLYDPEAAKSLALVRRRLDMRQYSQEYIDAIGQSHARQGKWSPAQVAAWLAVHANVNAGHYAIALIEVGSWAAPDKCRDENAAALADLPEPITASVDMGQHTDYQGDGRLSWSAPIRAERSTGIGLIDERHGKQHAVVAPYVLPPGGVPLEIGTTLPSRTFQHLRTGLGVARWPYESDWITLLINTQHVRRDNAMRGAL